MIKLTQFIEVASPFLRSNIHKVLSKPIYGGSFGDHQYRLASMSTAHGGLHKVVYMVTDPNLMFPISMTDTRGSALEYARGVIAVHGHELLLALSAVAKRQYEAAQESWAKANVDAVVGRKRNAALFVGGVRIPKRRAKVFEASGGKCHYCDQALTIDGKWHIEHKMPKALMGSDEPSNLVASCIACNLSKSDKTDVEFFAQINSIKKEPA